MTLTRKKKNDYFTKKHEDAIVKYTNSCSKKEREELYVSLISPAFNEMINKIVYTYKFTTLPNIEDLKKECRTWLPTILCKFNPDKGSKAFSYFSVIIKNWFIHKIKKNAVKTKREVSYDNISGELEHQHTKTVDTEDLIVRDSEFWICLLTEMNNWEDDSLRDADIKVLNAVKDLLDNIDGIEIFNKKAVYLYLRELTSMNTKQIAGSLVRIRKKYNNWKSRWDEGLV